MEKENNATGYLNKAHKLFHENKLPESIIFFHKTLSINPLLEKAYDPLYAMYSYVDEDYSNEAINYAHNALKINDKLPFVWAFIGHVYKTKREYKKALECFNQALYLEPTNERYWRNVIFIYRNLGLFDVAMWLFFSANLFMKAFSNEEIQDVEEFNLSSSIINLDLQSDNETLINKSTVFPIRVQLLFFSLPSLSSENGKRIIEILNRIEENNIIFKIVKPLPRCIFNKSDFLHIKRFYIDRNVRRIQGKTSQFCRNCLFLHYFTNNESSLKLCEKINNEYSIKCKNCIHKKRKDCVPCLA